MPIEKMPELDYIPSPCPKCGAVNEDEAVTMCKPPQGQTDEYECPGDFDEGGAAVQPSEASIKALDDWISARADMD